MPTKSRRMALRIAADEQEEIRRLAQSQSAPHRQVQRARILQQYLTGANFTAIAASVQTPRRIVYKCVDKALEMGIEAALKDLPHGRQTRVIQPEDKAWVVHLACSKPKDLGYAALRRYREITHVCSPRITHHPHDGAPVGARQKEGNPF